METLVLHFSHEMTTEKCVWSHHLVWFADDTNEYDSFFTFFSVFSVMLEKKNKEFGQAISLGFK